MITDSAENLGGPYYISGCPSQPRQVPHKELTLVEEKPKEVSQEEDGAGASGSDISVDSELDYFVTEFIGIRS